MGVPFGFKSSLSSLSPIFTVPLSTSCLSYQHWRTFFRVFSFLMKNILVFLPRSSHFQVFFHSWPAWTFLNSCRDTLKTCLNVFEPAFIIFLLIEIFRFPASLTSFASSLLFQYLTKPLRKHATKPQGILFLASGIILFSGFINSISKFTLFNTCWSLPNT